MMDNFEKWFFEGEEFSLRAERFYESLEAMESPAAKEANLVLWLKAAFEAGYAAGYVSGFGATEKSDALRENTLAGEENHAGDGGYSIGNREDHDAFVMLRLGLASKQELAEYYRKLDAGEWPLS
jgi:hypothetical protein